MLGLMNTYFLLALLFGLAGWVGFLTYQMGNLRRQHRILGRGLNEVNLYDALTAHIERVDEIEQLINDVVTEQEKQSAKLLRTVQLVGLVRYDAFGDMGGRLSFVLALLDARGNGVLVTTICGRQETRTYAKDIKGGKAAVVLTEEEQQAISQALGRRK